MIDIFVVAGNQKQFYNLCSMAAEPWESELKNKQVHYVEDVMALYGVPPGTRVFLYGTYQRREDWEKIKYELAMKGHRVLTMR